jgi:hypothetical protein
MHPVFGQKTAAVTPSSKNSGHDGMGEFTITFSFWHGVLVAVIGAGLGVFAVVVEAAVLGVGEGVLLLELELPVKRVKNMAKPE